MKSAFFREQKRYTQNELVSLLGGDESEVVTVLKRLKEYGVLKAVKASEEQKTLTDLLETDIEIADVEAGENEYFYVFTFVGVITIAGRVLKCYPKYLLNIEEPVAELKQVLKVIERYNNREQIIRMCNDSTDSTAFNMLAVMLWLLQDYYDNGSYTSKQSVSEINGTGEILWERTINDTFMIMNNKKPYYPDFITRRRVNDDHDYFKRLHECVLTRCSKELRDASILDLFDIDGAEISDEELDEFGETAYILDKITKELNVQFNTRKQLVLKTLFSYIANSSTHIDDMDCFSMYGTNSFNLIWERVCAEILDNQLERPLGGLHLPVNLSDKYEPDMKLIDVIDHPIWVGFSEKGIFKKQAKDTIIPDIIGLYNKNGEYRCIIFDAKYYNLQLEKNKPLRGQPGIESITKQYLYQMAYTEFFKDHCVSYFRNCFLMPTEEKEIAEMGCVTLHFLNECGLEDIQIRLLPAKMVFSLYLDNSKLSIDSLNL